MDTIGSVNLTGRLATLACGVDWPSAPEDVKTRLLMAVRDSIACGIAGSVTSLARIHRSANDIRGEGECTIIGTGQKAGVAAAAFHNATAINALDFDDTASVSGHPGAPVFAAAYAVAEREGSSGRELLSAILTGYEVAARVAVSCRPSPEQYAMVHGSQCFLGFGTVAAAGRLLKLDERQMARAFGIVAAITPIPVASKFGWDEGQLSWIKDNVNWPAEAGVRAAYLAANDFPASETIFDGERGFWRMIASDRFDGDALVDAETFYIRSLAFKPYPCCRWLHAAAEAFDLCLEQAGQPMATEVERIKIETTKGVASTFGAKRPKTMIDAQFSAPFTVGALANRIAKTDWWREETIRSQAIQNVMDAVDLVEDPAMTTSYFGSGRNVNRIPARVTMRLSDGREFAATCLVPSGTAGRSATSADDDDKMLSTKHRLLYDPYLSSQQTDRLMHALASLPVSQTLERLSAAIGGAVAKINEDIPVESRRG